MKNSNKYKILYFTFYSGLASYYVLFGIYLSETMHFSESRIGLILAIPSLTAIIFQPIWGGLSDAINSKKKLLFLITAILTVTIVFLGLIENKFLFILVFLIYTIALCGVVPLTDSMSVDYAKQNTDKNINFGDIRLCGSLGYAVMVYIVSLLAEKTSIKIMFIISSIAFFITLLILTKIKEYKSEKISQNYFKDIKKLLANKNYTLTIIFVFILLGTIFGSEQYLNLYMRKNEITIGQIGIITLLSVLMEIPTMYRIKIIVRRITHTNAMLIILFLTLTRYFLLPFTSTFTGFILLQLLRGIIVGVAVVMFVDYIVEIVPNRISTSALALFNALSLGLAQTIFVLLSGFITDILNYKALFFTYGSLNIICILIILIMKKINQAT